LVYYCHTFRWAFQVFQVFHSSSYTLHVIVEWVHRRDSVRFRASIYPRFVLGSKGCVQLLLYLRDLFLEVGNLWGVLLCWCVV
jgi:hypothetical protein